MQMTRAPEGFELSELRRLARAFMAKMVAHQEAWEATGVADRSAWLDAGKLGLLGPTVPEEYGGLGLDRRFAAVVMEEQARALIQGPGFSGHSNMAAPYIVNYGTEAQKQEWLPKSVSGEAIFALAMTEPDAGSDLQSIRTSAVVDGDDYVINGSKTFITNGVSADLIILACKTDPKERARGISLILVEADRAGLHKSKPMKKLGLKTLDTAELTFENVRVPRLNLLGEEGNGFKYLMNELAWERLQAAIWCAGLCEGLMDVTIQYTKDRMAFGRRIADFQNTKFKLAECAAQLQVLRLAVDQCVDLSANDALDPTTATMMKLWGSEVLGRVADECLQLHGGNGYMWEYPVARAYADARIMKIWAGTSEIMKEIIARKILE